MSMPYLMNVMCLYVTTHLEYIYVLLLAVGMSVLNRSPKVGLGDTSNMKLVIFA